MEVGKKFLHDLIAGHQFGLSLGFALRDVGCVHSVLLVDCLAAGDEQL